jgi:hypothetical protein
MLYNFGGMWLCNFDSLVPQKLVLNGSPYILQCHFGKFCPFPWPLTKNKVFPMALVPHSLRKNPEILQNFRHKNNTFKANFQQILFFNICPCNYGLALKGKNYLFTT